MNKLKKCLKCGDYTMNKEHCNEKTKEAGYKYIKLRDIKTTSSGD
jgi:rRNA maturation protein Nop10